MYILVRMHIHVHVDVYKHMYGVYKLVLTMYMSCTNVVEINMQSCVHSTECLVASKG